MPASVLSQEEKRFVTEALDFIERCLTTESASPLVTKSGWRDLVYALLVKVVDDLNAVVKLFSSNHVPQALIILRSTVETAMMVVHIGLLEECTPQVERWKHGQRISHWDFANRISHEGFDNSWYAETKRHLDMHVHPTVVGVNTLVAATNRGVDREATTRLRGTLFRIMEWACAGAAAIDPSSLDTAVKHMRRFRGYSSG
jgi:hypothetical protein